MTTMAGRDIIVCTTDGMIEITFVFNALLSLGLIIMNYLSTYIELLMKWVVPFIRKKGRPRRIVHNIFLANYVV